MSLTYAAGQHGNRYPLAKNAIFSSLQGEGRMRGVRMTFIRLAGCNVGCPQCDTDYSRARVESVDAIVSEAISVTPSAVPSPWAWITGGEPSMFDLAPLTAALSHHQFRVAIATSGVGRVDTPRSFLSVSPHRPGFVQRSGDELKLVDGLGGVTLDELAADCDDGTTDFEHRYVQPLSVGHVESPESLARCRDFLARNPTWALSRQDHLYWGVA